MFVLATGLSVLPNPAQAGPNQELNYCAGSGVAAVQHFLTSKPSRTAQSTGTDRNCHVFVSLGKPGYTAVTQRGQGLSLREAIGDAVSRLETKRNADSIIRLEVVTHARIVSGSGPDSVQAGMWGVASDLDLTRAIPPAEVMMRGLVDDQGRFLPGMISYFPRNADLLGTENAWPVRFITKTWVLKGDELQRLFRGHRQRHYLDARVLEQAARQGANYLVRATGVDGKMIYDFRPWLGQSTQDYSMLDHSGSLYSLLQAFGRFDDAKMLTAARLSMSYLVSTLRECPGLPDTLCVVDQGSINIGTNGLAILAMVQFFRVTGEREMLITAARLARWLVTVQDENGAFGTQQWLFPGAEPVDIESIEQPGQAIAAMVSLYQEDGNISWLESSEKAIAYLRNERDWGKRIDQLPHDQWLVSAIAEKTVGRPDIDGSRYALKIARSVMNDQNTGLKLVGEPADWKGSFDRPPRTMPAATRLELLLASWSLASRADQADLMPRILNTMCQAAGFTIQNQFTLETAMLTNDPASLLGGFHSSLSDYGIRIDDVQHNVTGFLGLARILRDEKFLELMPARQCAIQ